MLLQTRSTPVLTPDVNQKSVMQLGLKKLPAQDWLVDEDLPVFHAHKLQCAASNLNEVYAAMPGSEAVQQEFSDYLLQYLARKINYTSSQQQWQHRSGISWPAKPADLWHSSLMIAEDICLLEEDRGDYRLSAASVCSPSNWSVQDKIGKTVAEIHAPVPEYEKLLNARVNRLLGKLPDKRSLLRFNWSLQPGNELLWRGHDKDLRSPPYWRVERQTLLRLPVSGAIVFAIRIFLYEVASLPQAMRDDLGVVLKQLPLAERHYKGLDKITLP